MKPLAAIACMVTMSLPMACVHYSPSTDNYLSEIDSTFTGRNYCVRGARSPASVLALEDTAAPLYRCTERVHAVSLYRGRVSEVTINRGGGLCCTAIDSVNGVRYVVDLAPVGDGE